MAMDVGTWLRLIVSITRQGIRSGVQLSLCPQEVRGEKEIRWEESSLTKFSHFLGLSTEGLEKEILSFLVKIRKRRERIHSKGLLEKSKFERELKGLECSIDYEGEKKKKCSLQGRGCQLAEVQ